jgi:hypothetical protein
MFIPVIARLRPRQWVVAVQTHSFVACTASVHGHHHLKDDTHENPFLQLPLSEEHYLDVDHKLSRSSYLSIDLHRKDPGLGLDRAESNRGQPLG